MLTKFKGNVSIYNASQMCNAVHPRPCIDCDTNCLDNAFDDLLNNRQDEPMDADFDIDDDEEDIQ